MIGASPEVAARVERLTAKNEQLEAALAGAAAQLDDANAQIAALELELVSARSYADDWRDIAIQLAATCRDLRGTPAAARSEGHPVAQ